MAPARSPIVVPTDFSAAAAEAYVYALRLARATGARLHLLHVMPWPDAGPFEVPGEAPTAEQEEAEEIALARKALADAAGDPYRAGEVELAVRSSNLPAAEVASYAGEVDASLIVLGTSGRRPRRHTLGTVAGEVVQTAPCDVLLVPPREGAPFSESPVRRVLVPADMSGAARPLLALGVDLARALGAERVDLLHVLEPLPYPVRWIDETLLDLVPTIVDRAEAALHDLAAGEGSQEGAPPIAVHVERGKAARTVARAAAALETDLIVVGPHAERPLFDRLLGSVAEGVVRRAPCPVLVERRTAAFDEDEPLVDPWSYEPTEDDAPSVPVL